MVEPIDEFYMSAFWDLSTCRGMGLSMGPIPWNIIRDYAEFAGLDRPNGFAFAQIIRKLDAAYLKWVRDEQTAETERAKSMAKARAGARGGARGGIRETTTRGLPS